MIKKIIFTVLLILISINLVWGYTSLQELFYPVSNNDIQVCGDGLSTDFNYVDMETNREKDILSVAYFGTSITIQAEKTDLEDGFLYEFSWYVRPDSTLNFNVSYFSETENKWIQLDSKRVSEGTSWAMYKPIYLNDEITQAKINYNTYELITNVVPQ